MSPEKYGNELSQLENLDYIKNEFGDLIGEYLKPENKTEESNILLDIIIWRAKKLDKTTFNNLINYVSNRRKNETGDNNIQLLNLWSALERINPNEIGKNIEKNEDIPFEITGYMIVKRVKLSKLIKGDLDTEDKKIQISNCNIENMGNNRYFVSIKGQNRLREYSFIIQYEGHSIIRFFHRKGKRHLGDAIIKRQNIKVTQGIRKKGRFYKEEYDKASNIRVHIDDMDLYLNIYFKNR